MAQSKKARLAALLRTKHANSFANRAIDAITISFGLQNIAPTSLASGGSIFERLKSIVNEIGGRTTGLNVFPDAPHFQRQFSIEGALTNQQTMAGFTALIYNQIAKKVKLLPLKAESARFAKKNIAVGIATGVFNGNPIRFGFGGGTIGGLNQAAINNQNPMIGTQG